MKDENNPFQAISDMIDEMNVNLKVASMEVMEKVRDDHKRCGHYEDGKTFESTSDESKYLAWAAEYGHQVNNNLWYFNPCDHLVDQINNNGMPTMGVCSWIMGHVFCLDCLDHIPFPKITRCDYCHAYTKAQDTNDGLSINLVEAAVNHILVKGVLCDSCMEQVSSGIK